MYKMDFETTTYMYELLLDRIPDPIQNNTIWGKKETRLGICLIEFREHKYMKHVFNNMCNVYGGTDTTFYIIHGLDNEKYVKTIVKDMENVRLIKLNYHNIDISTYNELLTSYDLYSHFKTEFILFFQMDTLIRKRIPEKFFQYQYVGAPWLIYGRDIERAPNVVFGNKLVGNGGFSLRNVARMKYICKNVPYTTNRMNEDIFITNNLKDDEIPTVDEAKEFSVEMIYYDDPVGLHRVWVYMPFDKVRQLVQPVFKYLDST
jgi:hypothetical protein